MEASIKIPIYTWIRHTVIVLTLGLIGLIIGGACVVLPTGMPLTAVAFFALLLLWVLPDLRTVPASLAKRSLLIFIFSSQCIPLYYTIIIPGLPWLSLRRMALFIFAIPFFIVLSGSSKYRNKMIWNMSGSKFLYRLILMFPCVILISTVFSVNKSSSLGAVSNMITTWFLPFAAVQMVLRGKQDIIAMMRTLVLCILVDFVIGFIEFYLKRPFLVYALPHEIQAQLIAANPLFYTLFQGQGIRNGLYRAASTFNISLSWGEMAAMLAPIALHFVCHGITNRDRIVGSVGFVAAFGSIVCSGARGAYVGFLAACAVYAICWALRLNKQKPGNLIGLTSLAIMSVSSVAIVGAALFAGPLRMFVLGNGASQSSTDARWAEWALAKPKILTSPIWGYGPGTAGEVVGYYPNGGQAATVDSYVITALVDFGISGFIVLFLILSTGVFIGLRQYISSSKESSTASNALSCSLIAFLVYRITLSQQENMTIMCVVLSLLILSFRANSSEVAS